MTEESLVLGVGDGTLSDSSIDEEFVLLFRTFFMLNTRVFCIKDSFVPFRGGTGGGGDGNFEF